MEKIGLDLHTRQSQLAIRTADGEILERRIPDDARELRPGTGGTPARASWTWGAASQKHYFTVPPALFWVGAIHVTGAGDKAAVGTARGAVWEREFDRWLAPFWTALRDRRRERWGPVCMRGLLGPGERKSVGLLVARVASDEHEQVHHFVCASCWDPAPLDRVLGANAEDAEKPAEANQHDCGHREQKSVVVLA